MSLFFFFFKDPAPTEIYPLSLHDALPIAVPLLNRMKMADGAFDWDGYALVGIAPGLYKNETGGRREGCAVRWQSLQEISATCWRRIQVWVRRDSKAKADWRQRGP